MDNYVLTSPAPVMTPVVVPPTTGTPQPALSAAPAMPASTKPVYTLCINPGLMFDDDQSIHFNVSNDWNVEGDDNDDFFHSLIASPFDDTDPEVCSCHYLVDNDIGVFCDTESCHTTDDCDNVATCHTTDDCDNDIFCDAVSDFPERELDASNSRYMVADPTLMLTCCLVCMLLLPFFYFCTRLLLASVSLLLIMSSFSYMIHELHKSHWIQSGLVSNGICFAYPCKWLIFTCVMLCMSFVSMLQGCCQDKVSSLIQLLKDHFALQQPQKTADKLCNICLDNDNFNKHSLRQGLQCLALISSINILASLPLLHTKHDMSTFRHIWKHSNYMGLVLPSMITDPLILDSLRDYAANTLVNQYDLIDGAFHFIVDTGCSTSASPHKEDFESLFELGKPVTLHGIAGNSQVTQSGMLRFQ
jgi:hypothetical protein